MPPRAAPMVLLAASLGAAYALTLCAPAVTDLHVEEAINSLTAWAMRYRPPRLGLDLQYMSFCAGCTATGWLGAVSHVLFGDTLLAWKLVPALFAALFAASMLHLAPTPRAALIPAMALLFAPQLYTELAVIAWGNHVESMSVAMLGFALIARARRWHADALGGLALGVSLWIALTPAPLVLAAVLHTRSRRRALTLLPGLAVGVALWSAQYVAAGQHPLELIGYARAWTAPTTAAHGVGQLLDHELLSAIFGPRLHASPLGLILAATLPLACWIGRHDAIARSLGLACALWALFFVFSPFRLSFGAPDSPLRWYDLRYASPLLMLTLPLVARVACVVSVRPAALLLAPWLITGAIGRVDTWSNLHPSHLFERPSVDWRWVERNAIPRGAAWFATLPPGDARADATRSYAAGVMAGRRGEAPASRADSALRGLGASLPRCEDEPVRCHVSHPGLVSLPPDRREVALRSHAWRHHTNLPLHDASPADDEVGRVLAWATGMAAGARFGTPSRQPTPFPDWIDGPLGEPWAEGLATRAHERWGRLASPAPLVWPEAVRDAYTRSLRAAAR